MLFQTGIDNPEPPHPLYPLQGFTRRVINSQLLTYLNNWFSVVCQKDMKNLLRFCIGKKSLLLRLYIGEKLTPPVVGL